MISRNNGLRVFLRTFLIQKNPLAEILELFAGLSQQTVLSHLSSCVLPSLPRSFGCPLCRVFDAMAAFTISPGTNFHIFLYHAGLVGS